MALRRYYSPEKESGVKKPRRRGRYSRVGKPKVDRGAGAAKKYRTKVVADKRSSDETLLALKKARRRIMEARSSGADEVLRAVRDYDGDEQVFWALFALVVELGKSRAEMANWFGMAASTIGRWAKGEHSPPEYGRKALVESLGELMAKS